MNKSGMFKKKRVYFSQVSNNALRDTNLSLKAKGLYSLIQSYLTIPDFDLYKSFLEKQCKEGQKAFDSAWKELKEAGYLVQERYKGVSSKGKKGCFCWQYDLLDTSNHTPNVHSDNVHPSQNVPYGEGGIYNNTLSNNTDLNNTKESNTNLQSLYKIGWSGEVEPYIKSYLKIRSKFRSKKHKRINKKYIAFINDTVNKLIGNGVDLDMFKETVEEYFEDLPENNDGDIIYFLQVSQPRYFMITGDDERAMIEDYL
jgi:hypothetical protein